MFRKFGMAAALCAGDRGAGPGGRNAATRPSRRHLSVGKRRDATLTQMKDAIKDFKTFQ